MTRPTITAEDIAKDLDDHHHFHGMEDLVCTQAALVRALEQVRVVAEALHFKADRDGHPVLIGMLQLSEALAACEKAMGERE